jgi:hypothetical protein
MPGFTPELKKILRAHECKFIKMGRGDHEIWWTANAVLKQAGLKKAF